MGKKGTRRGRERKTKECELIKKEGEGERGGRGERRKMKSKEQGEKKKE